MLFNHNSVIDFNLGGKSQPSIARELKHFDVIKIYVYGVITRYYDTVTIAKRHETDQLQA